MNEKKADLAYTNILHKDANTASLINENLLTLLIIWIKHRNILYVPDFSPFRLLAEYLDCINPVVSFESSEKSIPEYQAPDICSCCLRYFGDCCGGRVRVRCKNCVNVQWLDRFYSEPWPNRMAVIINESPEYIEYHMAFALYEYMLLKQEGHDITISPRPSIEAISVAVNHVADLKEAIEKDVFASLDEIVKEQDERRKPRKFRRFNLT